MTGSSQGNAKTFLCWYVTSSWYASAGISCAIYALSYLHSYGLACEKGQYGSVELPRQVEHADVTGFLQQ